MEWAKAKNILIILLLTLNVLLGSVSLARYFENQGVSDVYQGVMSILGTRDITISCEIPDNQIESAYIIYESNRTQTLESNKPEHHDSLDMNTAEQIDTDIKKIMDANGIDLSAYILDNLTTDDVTGTTTAQYLLSYQGELVFDSWVHVKISSDGAVQDIRGTYRTVKGFAENGRKEVLPAYLVLLKNYTDSGTVIQKIDLGFIGREHEASAFKETEEGAVWRVRQEDGTTRFFEALYGDELVEVG